MQVRKWQLLSVAIIGTLVFFWSIPASNNSASGVYGGDSRAEILKDFPPLAGFLYSVQEERAHEFSIELSPLAYFIFALFWALLNGVSLPFFSWIPIFFARPHEWLRASIGIVLSVVLVPVFFYAVITLLSGYEMFRMFTDFGVHREYGFGIGLSGIFIDILRTPLWTLLLSMPNIILLVICIVRGKGSWLMRTIRHSS